MDSFRISGTSGGYGLEFFGRVPEDTTLPIKRFSVRLTGPNLSATAHAFLIGIEPHPASLFAEMAERWRGWPVVLAWETLEGELMFRCRQDRCGHVSINVELRSGCMDTDWSLRMTIETKAGQLERIARDAALFFGR